MKLPAYLPGRLLAAGVVAAAVMAASSASADVYELSYTTQDQTGDIFFTAPAPGSLPGTAPNITNVSGTETTTSGNG